MWSSLVKTAVNKYSLSFSSVFFNLNSNIWWSWVELFALADPYCRNTLTWTKIFLLFSLLFRFQVKAPQNDRSLSSAPPCSHGSYLSLSPYHVCVGLPPHSPSTFLLFFHLFSAPFCHSIFTGRPPGGTTFWWHAWQETSPHSWLPLGKTEEPRQSHIVR